MHEGSGQDQAVQAPSVPRRVAVVPRVRPPLGDPYTSTPSSPGPEMMSQARQLLSSP